MKTGTPLLWAVGPQTSVVAGVPTAAGDGKVLFCQLQLQDCLVPGSAAHDPVAERVLLNLLAG